MKKIILVLLITLLVCLAGCGEKHEHTWSEWNFNGDVLSDYTILQERECIECGEWEQRSVETERIEFSMENFSKYFEYVVYVSNDSDAFDEIKTENVDLVSGWKLKEEFVRRFIQVDYQNEPYVRVRFLEVPYYNVEFYGEGLGEYKVLDEFVDPETYWIRETVNEHTRDSDFSPKSYLDPIKGNYGFGFGWTKKNIGERFVYAVYSSEDVILENVKGAIYLLQSE